MITKEIKVVFLGEQSTGKTSLIQRYINNIVPDDITPTKEGIPQSKFVHCRGYDTTIKMEIWDTPGGANFKHLNKIFYREAQVIVFVYSLVVRESYIAIQNYWLKQIREHCKKNPCILPFNVSILHSISPCCK